MEDIFKTNYVTLIVVAYKKEGPLEIAPGFLDKS
jgi:hypothetical protein